MDTPANVGSDGETAFYTPPRSSDPAWQFGYLPKPTDANTVVCRLCKKVLKGGIYRFKQHLAHRRGNISPCPKVDEKTKKQMCVYLDELMKKKVQKAKEYDKIKGEVDIMGDAGLERMDKLSQLSESIDDNMGSHIPMCQIGKEDAISGDHRERVISYISRWVYMSSIPFHALETKSFLKMVEAIGQYGPGLNPPTMNEISGPYLKNAVKRVSNELNCHREMWKKRGCSLIIDVWTDIYGRNIMNFCVNCYLGTSFLKSMDVSSKAHTTECLLQLVDQCIKEVGKECIVQVVTDIASTNVVTKGLLQTKYPEIWCTSCAAHSIDLVFQEISKEVRVESAIAKGKILTRFIYSHPKTLSLMRKFTKKRHIAISGETRFATTFLTLESIFESKDKLMLLFSSDGWRDSKLSKTRRGEGVSSIVLSPTFWNEVTLAIEVFTPLVRLLRLVVADRKPSMGFVYGGLEEAKQEVMSSCNGVETSYKSFVDAIVSKTKGRLDTSLHLTAYFLNPYFFYKDRYMFDANASITKGFLDCMESIYPDLDIQDIITRKELPAYKRAEGKFGKPLAVKQRSINAEHFDPAHWWFLYGDDTPHLQVMAIRILSLSSSSRGCERNWSAFESIHTKKRSKLETERLNDLFYVRFNSNLKERRQDQSRDPIRSKDRAYLSEWTSCEQTQDEEVYPASGSICGLVPHLSGDEEILQPKRSRIDEIGMRASSSCSSALMLEEEDGFSSEEIDEDGEDEDFPLDDDDD